MEKGQIYFIRPYIGVEVGVGTGRITATTAAIRQDKPQALAIKLATGGLGPRFRRAPVRSPRQTGGGLKGAAGSAGSLPYEGRGALWIQCESSELST